MQFLATFLPPAMVAFILGLLLVDYACKAGGTMEERRAVVFEVYRYSICLITMMVFGLTAFQMAAMLLTPSGAAAAGVPAAGAIISILLFVAHWFMKNPALPKKV